MTLALLSPMIETVIKCSGDLFLRVCSRNIVVMEVVSSFLHRQLYKPGICLSYQKNFPVASGKINTGANGRYGGNVGHSKVCLNNLMATGANPSDHGKHRNVGSWGCQRHLG